MLRFVAGRLVMVTPWRVLPEYLWDPTVMSSVLGIVIRAVSSHLIASAGFTRAQAQTGAVTLIQRFGGALNLNVHFHMLFLDGVYATRPGGGHRFVKTEAPSLGEMTELVQRIASRVGRHLERRFTSQVWPVTAGQSPGGDWQKR